MAPGQPVVVDRGPQDLEVAGGVLLVAEQRGRDPARRIVDGTDEDELRTTLLEPAMATAVELEERALGAHARPSAAIARRPPTPGAGDARAAEDRAQALATDHDPLALGEELAEVGVVERAIALAQLDDPDPPVGVDALRRCPAPVAVDEARRPRVDESRSQTPELPLRQPELDAALGHGQLTHEDPGQHSGPSLLSGRHRDRRLHWWRLTNSLGS